MTDLEKLVSLLKKSSYSLGAAESFTGGLFASNIVNYPGVSKFFKGSIVTYATEEKINVLGVDEKIIKNHGVVSKECALEMAKNAQRVLNVDIAVSFTGNAGPDVMENKPAGVIYIGIAFKDISFVEAYHLSGDRESVRKEALELACKHIIKIIS